MNVRCNKRPDGHPVKPIPLLVALLLGSVLAGLLPQVALAQGGRQDLDLRLVSRDNYGEVTAGESKVILLEVRNIGTEAVDEIELSALHPDGWRVTLDPDQIGRLNPKDSLVIEVTVETPPELAQGSNEIILRADSVDVHRATSVWMWVEEPEGRWLWVGATIAVVVIAGFVAIFLRFGRD